MTPITFSLVNTWDRTDLLKSGLIINEQRKAVRDYIIGDRLVIVLPFNTASLKLAHMKISAAGIGTWKYISFLKRMILICSVSMKLGLQVILSLIFQIISICATIDQEHKGEELLSWCILVYINFSIAHTCSSIDNDNEALTIILKDLQYVLNISTVCILPGFTTNILALTAWRWINGILHWKMLSIMLISLLLITAYLLIKTAEQIVMLELII